MLAKIIFYSKKFAVSAPQSTTKTFIESSERSKRRKTENIRSVMNEYLLQHPTDINKINNIKSIQHYIHSF